jgi:hypothetical protein
MALRVAWSTVDGGVDTCVDEVVDDVRRAGR